MTTSQSRHLLFNTPTGTPVQMVYIIYESSSSVFFRQAYSGLIPKHKKKESKLIQYLQTPGKGTTRSKSPNRTI